MRKPLLTFLAGCVVGAFLPSYILIENMLIARREREMYRERQAEDERFYLEQMALQLSKQPNTP